jgi:hypothetical protein
MIRYEQVSGVVFALIAVAQLARAVLRVPAQVGTVAVPIWLSFVAFAVSATLAIWAFRTPRGAA